MKRMSTKNGRKVLARRRTKGRARLTHWRRWPQKYVFVVFFVNPCFLISSGLFPSRFGIIMLYTQILKDNRNFLALYKKGRYIASKYSVIYVMPNNRPYNRFGITAGKKIGNAVCRNRAKRLIRLAYRQSELELPIGIDIVIVARQAICGIKSDEYCAYMHRYGVKEIHKAVEKTIGKLKK